MGVVARYGLFAVVIGFSLGALVRSLFVFSLAGLGFIALITLVIYVAWHFTRVHVYALVAIALVTLMFGAGRTMIAPWALPDSFVPRIGSEVTLEGVVVSDPDIRETSQRIVIEVTEGNERTRILAVVPLHPDITYRERVGVTGYLSEPEPFETEGGREFRYDRYLSKDGIFAVMLRASIESRAEPTGLRAHTLGSLYDAKRAFMNGIEAALPEPSAGLASGILVGGKQGLGSELYDAFVVSGLVHIVVLSGYNVMIVANAFMRGFRRFGKRASYLIAGTSILLFVLAAGAGAASVRAGAMAALGLFARASGRTYDALRALSVVVLLMLLYNPLLIAYDVGFQFSLAATIGLIVGTPIVERFLLSIRNAFIREIAATTIAAQVGVLPILLYQTGILSPYALVANLVVLPIIPLAMLFSFVAAIVGIVVPIAAPLFGAPAYLTLSYVRWIAEITAALPGAGTVVPEFTFFIVVLAYAALFIGVLYAQRNAPTRS